MKGGRSQPYQPARATGAYILLIRVRGARALDIGRLGRVRFPGGNYVYIGSGMGGLEARVARHFRRDKKVKWHIDRLLPRAELLGAVLFPSTKRNECELARSCLSFPGARAVQGFGSSDCRCAGHLVHLGTAPFGALLRRLDGRVQGSGFRVQGDDEGSRARGQGNGRRKPSLNPVPCTLSLPCTLNPVPCTLVREALH
jgi:Uri superfamily endonuclease